MSHQLHEPLHDLVAEVPSYVAPDARAAWSAGARRRTRRRVGVAGLVVLLVLAASAGIGLLPHRASVPPVDQPGGGVDGHPSRIDYPYWTRDLPERPGPVAGVLERVSHAGTADQPLGWFAVSPTGNLWHLPGSNNNFTPAISPDGTRLAYLDTRPGRWFEIRDLREGSTTSIDIGDNPDSREPWLLRGQSPLFWSPDSSRLLAPVYAAKHNRQRGVDALVLDDRGATEVRRPRTREAVMPVGWVSDSSLAWLVWHETKGTVDAARVQVTDDHGRLQRTVRLDVGRGVGDLSQWAGVVSPDGRTLALGATAQEHRTAVHFYDLTTGRLRSTMPGVPDAAGVCLPSWGDGTLQVPTENSLRDTVLRSINGSTTILADPRLGAGCSLWATDALDGPAHAGLGGTIFGDSTSWLSWHWREIAAGAAGGLALLGLLVGLRRLRRRARLSG
ncbi:TolB-like translocation protein [Nocardioides ungokensis]